MKIYKSASLAMILWAIDCGSRQNKASSVDSWNAHLLIASVGINRLVTRKKSLKAIHKIMDTYCHSSDFRAALEEECPCLKKDNNS